MTTNTYGATHINPTTGILYKHAHINCADNTSKKVWHYLSFCNIWMGSGITEEQASKLLVELDGVK